MSDYHLQFVSIQGALFVWLQIERFLSKLDLVFVFAQLWQYLLFDWFCSINVVFEGQFVVWSVISNIINSINHFTIIQIIFFSLPNCKHITGNIFHVLTQNSLPNIRFLCSRRNMFGDDDDEREKMIVLKSNDTYMIHEDDTIDTVDTMENDHD